MHTTCKRVPDGAGISSAFLCRRAHKLRQAMHFKKSSCLKEKQVLSIPWVRTRGCLEGRQILEAIVPPTRVAFSLCASHEKKHPDTEILEFTLNKSDRSVRVEDDAHQQGWTRWNQYFDRLCVLIGRASHCDEPMALRAG